MVCIVATYRVIFVQVDFCQMKITRRSLEWGHTSALAVT